MTLKLYKYIGIGPRIFRLLAVFSVLLFLAACGAANYGTLSRDRDLDNMFSNYEILPDHRYYSTGGYDAPNAILAIHRDYELDNPGNLWIPVPNIDSGQIRKWVDTIAPDMNYRGSGAYFASYIVDPDGKRVGAWYAYTTFTTVKFLEGNKIQVYTPELNKNIYHNRGLRMRSSL